MSDEPDTALYPAVPTWTTPTGTVDRAQILTPISAAGEMTVDRNEDRDDRSNTVLVIDHARPSRLASQSPALARAAQDVCAAADEAPPYPGARIPGRRDWEQSQRRRRGR